MVRVLIGEDILVRSLFKFEDWSFVLGEVIGLGEGDF